jgi:hypothetical protein
MSDQSEFPPQFNSFLASLSAESRSAYLKSIRSFLAFEKEHASLDLPSCISEFFDASHAQSHATTLWSMQSALKVFSFLCFFF